MKRLIVGFPPPPHIEYLRGCDLLPGDVVTANHAAIGESGPFLICGPVIFAVSLTSFKSLPIGALSFIRPLEDLNFTLGERS